MSLAFEYLSSIEQRCKSHAVGLPEKVDVVDDWVGISFLSHNVPCIAKMSEITEILPVPETIRIPGVKTWVKGLANIRGSLMPILDLQGFVSEEATVLNKKSRILVVNQLGVLAGLLVQEVYGLRRFKQNELGSVKQEQQDFHLFNHYISGSFSKNKEFWNVFNIQKLLATDKFLRVV